MKKRLLAFVLSVTFLFSTVFVTNITSAATITDESGDEQTIIGGNLVRNYDFRHGGIGTDTSKFPNENIEAGWGSTDNDWAQSWKWEHVADSTVPVGEEQNKNHITLWYDLIRQDIAVAGGSTYVFNYYSKASEDTEVPVYVYFAASDGDRAKLASYDFENGEKVDCSNTATGDWEKTTKTITVPEEYDFVIIEINPPGTYGYFELYNISTGNDDSNDEDQYTLVGDNLFVDPSFETGLNTIWEAASDWPDGTNNAAPQVITTNDAVDGTHVMNASTRNSNSYWNRFSQTVNVTPGKTYYISYWSKAAYTGTRVCPLYVQFLDSETGKTSLDCLATGAWEQTTAYITIPDDCVAIYVAAENGSTTDRYYDNFEIYEAVLNTDDNENGNENDDENGDESESESVDPYVIIGDSLLVNGSFENSSSPWNPTSDWADGTNNAAPQVLTTVNAADGTHVMNTHNYGAGVWNRFNQKVAVEPGKTYYISFYSKASRNIVCPCYVLLYDEINDVAGASASTKVVMNTTATGNWEQTTAYITIPDDYEYGFINIAAENGDAIDRYYDNFEMFEAVPAVSMIGSETRLNPNDADDYAIRFSSKVSNAALDILEGIGATNIEYGTYILPTAILDGATLDESAVAEKAALKIPGTITYSEDEDGIVYTGVLVDIPEEYTGVAISAAAYLTYELDGETVTMVTDVMSNSYDELLLND